MTQQNNIPEDPRDSSEDYTRPLNSQDDTLRAPGAFSESTESSASPRTSETPSHGSVSSSSAAPSPYAPQGSQGQNNYHQQNPYNPHAQSAPSGQSMQNAQNGNYGQQAPYAGAAAGSSANGYPAYSAAGSANNGNYGNGGYGNNGNGFNQNPYNNGAPYGPNGGKRANNVLGLIALGSSVLGLILGCIPVVAILGWILLFAGFVMGIIALVQKNKSKWAGITAIVVSVLGTILSMIIVFVVAVTALAESTDGEYSTSTSSPSSSAASEETPAAADSSTGNIGDTYVWDDGVSLTISQPEAFKPSDTAAGAEDKELKDIQKYTVTIKNDSDEAVDPILFTMTGNSGGKEAQQIFDSQKNIGSAPSTKIQPGKSVSFDVAYAMVDHKDASFDVSLDFDRDEVTFIQK